MNQVAFFIVAACFAAASAYQCRPEGERCIGAHGKPYVEYGVGCCPPFTCTVPDEEYGLKCGTASTSSGGKCRPEGERCIGAPGKPFVPYGVGCCAPYTCATPDEEYGHKCGHPSGVTTSVPTDTATLTTTTTETPTPGCNSSLTTGANCTGNGPFPEESFDVFTFVEAGANSIGTIGEDGTGLGTGGVDFVFDYNLTVNQGGLVSLSGADKVVTSVQCIKGGEVRVLINPEYKTKSALEKMYPIGSVLLIDSSIYGECNLPEYDAETERKLGEMPVPGAPESGFLYIESVSGTVHDAHIVGRPGTYFDVFQEGDLSYRRATNQSTRAVVSRQTSSRTSSGELEFEAPFLKIVAGLKVENKNDVELLTAKWSLPSFSNPAGSIDIVCKFAMEYVAVFEAKVTLSAGKAIRKPIKKISFPLYGFKLPELPKIAGVEIIGLDVGLFFDVPLIFGVELAIEKDLPVPLTATVNSGRKEIVMTVSGTFLDLDMSTEYPVNTPATTNFNLVPLQAAIDTIKDSPTSIVGAVFIGFQPAVALKLTLLYARVSFDFGLELEAKMRALGSAYAPTDEGTVGYCESCHKAQVELKQVVENFGFFSGASIKVPLPVQVQVGPLKSFTLKKTFLSKTLPGNPSLSRKLFTACLLREFGDQTEVCGSGSNAICCDKSLQDNTCKIQGGQPTCAATPTPVPSPSTGPTAGIVTDPNLISFDKLAFSCQASGEFILARAAASGLMLQARFTGPTTSGSVVSGFAIEDGGSSRLQLHLAGNTSVADSSDCASALRLVVDGESQQEVESKTFGADPASSIELVVNESGGTVSTAPGTVVTFRIRRSSKFGCFMQSFSASISAQVSAQVSGLLGTPNGDSSDDWQRQNGTVLAVPEGRNDRLFGTAYQYCTENWCIRDANSSIFTHEDGQSQADFAALCERPYERPDLSAASEELRTLCRGSQQCLVDGVVGDLEDARGGVAALAEMEKLLNIEKTNVTLPSNSTGLVLKASFTWTIDADLDTSASWLGETVGFGCGGDSDAAHITWSNDVLSPDVNGTAVEFYEIDLDASRKANAWSGFVEITFGAGWYIERTDGSRATLRMSMEDKETKEEVQGTSLEQVFTPGAWSGGDCATKDTVVVAKLTETAGGIALEVEGL